MLNPDADIPSVSVATLVLPAEIEELDRVNEFIHAELERRRCPMRAQYQLDIAVEELFVNVCSYAYPNGTGTLTVRCTYTADPASVTVELIDTGIPFDPLARPGTAMPADIADVPIGGLGILMARKSVDEMRYERVDGSNIVTIVKRW